MTLASQSPPRPTGRRRFPASSGALSERPTLFRRSYYVCPNGHWSIADSDAKILPCNSCTQITERDYEIIERRSRAIILDRFVEARRRTKGALVSLNAHRMIANAAARQVVRDSDRELLWDRACRSLFGQGPSDATIRLATGDAVAISCDPIMDGAEPVGALIRLSPSSSTQLPRPVVGWSSLTESERAIAHLVAQGLTNREAAAHLFVSRHTVGAHLRQIFRKLEINSRVQLAHLVALHEEDRPAGAATAPRDKDT